MKNYKEVADSVFQRSDEIITDNRRRKKRVMSVALPIICCVLVAAVGFGTNWKEFVTDDPTNIIEPTDIETPTGKPEPIVTEPITEEQPTDEPDTENSQGGGEGQGSEGYFEYERAYDWRIYTLSGLYDYIMEHSDADLNEWIQERTVKTKDLKYGISSPEYVPFIIEIINSFDVPKEAFEEINSEKILGYESMGDNPFSYGCYTQEEIDALYSNNSELISKSFASKYSLISNGKAYAPRFYLQATKDELNEYNITQQQVNEKIDQLLEDEIIVIRDGEIMLLFNDGTVLPLY